MPTAIFIDRITKAFPAAGGVTLAVNDISLHVEPGELFFLLGPSGCGKTTLLRMIAGFIEPTNGRILFGLGSEGVPSLPSPPHPLTLPSPLSIPPTALDITRVPPNKRNTGMVFQSYALWPHMTVAQNVSFGLEIRKIPAADRAGRVRDALAAVHMGAYADRKPNQLSGGQQQRVALARALVIRPSVLLLDEPLSNLDAKLRLELRSEIRRICKDSGITTIYVTHDQKEALSMADRVAILDNGRVVQWGSPETLYRRPANRFVAEFLGETNILRANVLRADGTTVEVEVGAARLTATAPGGSSPPAHDAVTLSVRPESVRLVPSDTLDAIPATLLDTTYLGELAQHTVQLRGGPTLRLATLNPAPSRQPPPYPVHLAINPEDAVILPA